jgi:hypothetical protein
LESHLQRLAGNVQTLLSRSTHGAEAHPPVTPPPAYPEKPTAAHITPAVARPTWAYAVIGGLTAVVVILGFLMFWFKSHDRSSPPQTTAQTNAIAPASQPAPNMAPPVESKKTPVPAAQPAMPKQPSPVKSTPLPDRPRAVALHYIPGSSIKLEQLIGEENKERHQPTRSRTFKRYQIRGAELGYSFEHEGRAYFLFGDTMGRLARAADTIATTDVRDPEPGIELNFLTVGDQYLTIDPPGISMGASEVPVAGISLGSQMYVAVSTNFSKDRATDRSVLTKLVPPSTFQPLRTISELPAGRFIKMSMHDEPGPIAGLPPGGPFVLTWGTSKYRESDAYLSIVPVAQFETGKGTRYFAGLNPAGAPLWSEKESDATPIVKDGTLGDLSVTWCKDLSLWLMTYDRRTPVAGIAFSYSHTPWGPWSEPQVLFNPVRDVAFGKFIHNPQAQPDDGVAGPVFGPKNQANAAAIRGGAYAPYVVERWTKAKDSELDLYYVLSTFNPYVVVLMKSRLAVE